MRISPDVKRDFKIELEGKVFDNRKEAGEFIRNRAMSYFCDVSHRPAEALDGAGGNEIQKPPPLLRGRP